jgi:hypothetical protein
LSQIGNQIGKEQSQTGSRIGKEQRQTENQIGELLGNIGWGLLGSTKVLGKMGQGAFGIEVSVEPGTVAFGSGIVG